MYGIPVLRTVLIMSLAFCRLQAAHAGVHPVVIAVRIELHILFSHPRKPVLPALPALSGVEVSMPKHPFNPCNPRSIAVGSGFIYNNIIRAYNLSSAGIVPLMSPLMKIMT